jgi:hypothetical protein
VSRFWRKFPGEHWRPRLPSFLTRSKSDPVPDYEYYIREADELDQKFSLLFPPNSVIDLNRIDGLASQLSNWLSAFQTLLKRCKSNSDVYQQCQDMLWSHQTVINWFIDNYRHLIDKSSIGSTRLKDHLLSLRSALLPFTPAQTR